MTLAPEGPLALLWGGWAGYWLFAARGSPAAERAEPRGSRLAHLLLVASALALLFSGPLLPGPLAVRWVDARAVLVTSGLLLTGLGLGLSVWARLHLGRHWSGAVAIHREQQLIRSGPYALVRHPIYAGLLLAFAGSAVAVGTLAGALGAALGTAAYVRKLRLEERWLDDAFGEAYAAYRLRAGGVLPFRALAAQVGDSLSASQESLLHPAELEGTLDRLREAGQLSGQRARLLREGLPRAVAESTYVLRHLGAHLGIGVIFAFDVVPLPLGTIARVAWVVGNRVVETARRARERARIHSLPVALVAAIPWLGYGAYLLPLRRESAELTWLLAHHLSFRLHGTSFEEQLATKPRWVRRAGSWLVPDLPDSDLPDSDLPDSDLPGPAPRDG